MFYAVNETAALYTGVTSEVVKQVYEHRNILAADLSGKYADHHWFGMRFIQVPDPRFFDKKQVRISETESGSYIIKKNSFEWNDLYVKLVN